jgi:pimeloyl-ACP methyl ester carboxylesterase
MLNKKRIRTLKKLTAVLLVIVIAVFFTKCYALKKYMRSDKELEEHYQTLPFKPLYKSLPFQKRSIHYSVISRNDSLPLLVFVHGAPGAWYGYQNLMDDTLLQKKFRIVSVDRLGYGKSGYGDAETSVKQQALSIEAVIEKENLCGKKVTLFGRSYGAPIMAWLAIQHPEKVEKLFMISPVIDPDKEKFYWFSKPGKWKPVQWFLPEMLNVATAEKFAHPAEMRSMLPKWEHLYVPTVVVTGNDDHIADTANFSFARKHLVNCDTTMIRLDHVGHLVTYQKPELIRDLLLSTLPLSRKAESLQAMKH